MSRSGGLSDSMNHRTVSTPYASMIPPGSTVFSLLFDIFSTRPTVTSSPVTRCRATSPIRSTSPGGSHRPSTPLKLSCVTIPCVNSPANAPPP